MATEPNLTLIGAIVAWFATLAAGIFGYGKLNERVDAIKESHNRRLSVLENEDVMTVGEHREICSSNTNALSLRVETLCQKIEVWHKEDIEGRKEFNKRIGAIESSVVAIETELRIRNEKEK